MKSRFACLLVLGALTICQGCGTSNDSTVIMPGPDYQLSEQEEANAQAEMEMRKGG